MATTLFKPALWSAKINRELEKALVFGALANREYQGLISKEGDTVHVNRVGATTVNDYAGTITYQKGDGATQTILIDNKKYFALEFDDVDEAQRQNGIASAQIQDAAYRMADAIDIKMASLQAKVAAGNRIAVDLATPLAAGVVDRRLIKGMYALNRAANKANMPKIGRYVVFSAEVEEQLLNELDGKALPQTADMVLINGYIGKIAGFEIFTSNNTVVDSKVHKCMGGLKGKTTHFLPQLTKVEAGRKEGSFSDFVRGLELFGADVAETGTGKGFTDIGVCLDVTFA